MLHFANDINNQGQIVGEGTVSGVGSFAYVLTPIVATLTGPTPGLAGQVNTLVVEKATPGNFVSFFLDLNGGETLLPGCLESLDLTAPILLGNAVANAEGRATFGELSGGVLLRNVPGAETKKLSIVVLPFNNLSDNKSHGYFADGITEDLITDLSRIKGMFVIARGTSFTYKGKTVKATDVARDLKVRYVLEGSVRRDGDQVRVNAQLIDGQT